VLCTQVFVTEVNLNRTSVKQLAPTSKTQLSQYFEGRLGGHYRIQVSSTADGAIPCVPKEHYGPAIPVPHQVQILPEKNGSYIVYWKDRDLPQELREGDFHYMVMVSEGQWQGEDKAKKYDVKGPPFILKDVQMGTNYYVAVKLVTSEGYQSKTSEVIAQEMPQGKQFFIILVELLVLLLNVKQKEIY
jgi:hypothetical protein